jgi:hypothetical protein
MKIVAASVASSVAIVGLGYGIWVAPSLGWRLFLGFILIGGSVDLWRWAFGKERYWDMGAAFVGRSLHKARDWIMRRS